MLATHRAGARELPRGAVMHFTTVDGIVRASPRSAHNTAGIAARIRGGVLEEFSFGGRALAPDDDDDDDDVGAAQGEARAQIRAHARAQAWGKKGGKEGARKEESRSFWRWRGGGEDEWASERRGWAWRGGVLRRGATFAQPAPEKRGARAGARAESGRFAALGRRFRAAAPQSQSSEAGTTSSEADDEHLWGG